MAKGREFMKALSVSVNESCSCLYVWMEKQLPERGKNILLEDFCMKACSGQTGSGHYESPVEFARADALTAPKSAVSVQGHEHTLIATTDCVTQAASKSEWQP